MNTYLWVCGIILNVLVFLAVVYGIVDAIHVSRYNKKKAAERTRIHTLYNEELETAKQAWQKWAEQLQDLEQERAQENNQTKHMRAGLKVTMHQFESYRFTSTGKAVRFEQLGKENGWTLQEASAKSA